MDLMMRLTVWGKLFRPLAQIINCQNTRLFRWHKLTSTPWGNLPARRILNEKIKSQVYKSHNYQFITHYQVGSVYDLQYYLQSFMFYTDFLLLVIDIDKYGQVEFCAFHGTKSIGATWETFSGHFIRNETQTAKIIPSNTVWQADYLNRRKNYFLYLIRWCHWKLTPRGERCEIVFG